MIQCFTIIDEYGSPVQGAKVNTIVGNSIVYTGFTSPSGEVNSTITPFSDNLIYVRLNSYTPVQYVYSGSGGESCIEITIKTCHALVQEPLDEGRFLVWKPIAYCIREQTLPLEICNRNYSQDNPICDRFETNMQEDYYSLPVKNNDSIKWIMDLVEVDYDNDDVENLRIGITKDGVIVSEDIGTISLFGTQLFCEAIVPCLLDCEYEFVIYRIDIIDYIGLVITPPTSPTACDGAIRAVVTLGTPPYEYSLDGENWQSSDTFINLCAFNYTVYARDSDCSQGQKTAYLQVIDCGIFQGYTLQQIIDIGVTIGQLVDSGCTLCDFVPLGNIQQTFISILENGDFHDSSIWSTVGTTIVFGDHKVTLTRILGNTAISQGPGTKNGYGFKVSLDVVVLSNSGGDAFGVNIQSNYFYGTSSGHYEFSVPPFAGDGSDTTVLFALFPVDFSDSVEFSNVKLFELIDCE